MKFIYLLLLSLFISLNLASQSFKNVEELIIFSRKTPSNLEKKLKAKGFEYVETKNERQRFRSSRDRTSFNYQLNPRIIEYGFTNRQFYLDAYSYLVKAGYTISKGALVTIGTGKKHSAEKFTNTKRNNELYLFQETENGNVSYEILVYPGVSADGSLLPDKEDFAYACLYASLLSPSGLIAVKPTATNSVEQSFQGKVGIGAGSGMEFGISGVAGFYGINKKLPYFVDFGLHLRFMGGFQTYTLASVDYSYKDFLKVGAGGGPSITITPFRNHDLRFSGYYDFIPSISMGGAVNYKGSNQNYSKTVARVDGSFALIKVIGLEIKYASISVGFESSTYIDKGKYENKSGTTLSMSTSKFDANILMSQTALKFGFCF